MNDFLGWFYELHANTDWQATFAGISALVAFVAVGISLWAIYYSHRSSAAAERSANAAENANKHAEKSADAAEVSSNLAQASFENEAKRVRASAYWTLYRIHGQLDSRSVPDDATDLSPVYNLLAVYPHTFTDKEKDTLITALNGIEHLIALSPQLTHDDVLLVEKVRRAVLDANMILRKDWMAIDAIDDKEGAG